MAQIRDGRARIVYCSPERFAQPGFMNAVGQREVDLLAVDEAHCISEWGHDFRPDYLRLPRVLERLGRPTVMACTATATEDVSSRDRPAPRPPRPADDPRGLRPPQPQLRHRPVRGQGIEGAQAGDAAPRPPRRGQPPGDRLLRDPQGHRGGRPVPARGRPQRRRLPRGHGPRRARLRPAPLHDRRRRGDHRHQRLRHGSRQGQRPLGLALGDPDERRGLLPGGRPRGPRRPPRPSRPPRRPLRPGPPGPLHPDARGRARVRLPLRPAPQGRLRQRGPPHHRRPARRRGPGQAGDRRASRRLRGGARPRRPPGAPLQRPNRHGRRPSRLQGGHGPLLARLPRGRVVQLRRELPAAEAARPLRGLDPGRARGPLLRRLRSGVVAAVARGARGEGEAPELEVRLSPSRPLTRGRVAARGAPGLAPEGRARQARLHGRQQPNPRSESPPRAPRDLDASPRSTASARRS